MVKEYAAIADMLGEVTVLQLAMHCSEHKTMQT